MPDLRKTNKDKHQYNIEGVIQENNLGSVEVNIASLTQAKEVKSSWGYVGGTSQFFTF